MKKWLGAAGVCLNDKNELLMVLEGAGKWSVPTGGLNDGETFEECALREVEEETGYAAEIVEKLQVKSGTYEDVQIAFEVHYFLMKIIGGKAQIQDPDKLILDIAWKSEEEVRHMALNYPEDRQYLLGHLRSNRDSSFLVLEEIRGGKEWN